MRGRGVYRSIYACLVDDPDFQALSGDAQHIFFILRICPEAGLAGIFRYYVDQVAARSHRSRDVILACLEELARSGWVYYDDSVLWVRNALRFEPKINLSNPNHLAAIYDHLLPIPLGKPVVEFCRYYKIHLPNAQRALDLKLIKSLDEIDVAISAAGDRQSNVDSIPDQIPSDKQSPSDSIGDQPAGDRQSDRKVIGDGQAVRSENTDTDTETDTETEGTSYSKSSNRKAGRLTDNKRRARPPAGDNGSGKRRPRRPSSPKKPPANPDAQTLIDYWHQLFIERFDNKPIVAGGKVMKAAQSLLQGRNLENAMRIVYEHMHNPDRFYADKGLFGLEHAAQAANSILATLAQESAYRPAD